MTAETNGQNATLRFLPHDLMPSHWTNKFRFDAESKMRWFRWNKFGIFEWNVDGCGLFQTIHRVSAMKNSYGDICVENRNWNSYLNHNSNRSQFRVGAHGAPALTFNKCRLHVKNSLSLNLSLENRYEVILNQDQTKLFSNKLMLEDYAVRNVQVFWLICIVRELMINT